MSIRIVVAEDMSAIKKRIIRVLDADHEIEVVGSAENGYEAVLQVAIQKPDILLTDIEMADRTDGLKAIVQVLDKFPDIKVIILTVHEDDDFIFKAYEFGVSDYILKNASEKEMIQRIKAVYHEKATMDATIAEKLRQEFKRIRSAEQSFIYCINVIAQLTPMEITLLKLCTEGKTRKEICEINSVELSTVKSQINSILKKTGKSSMQELQIMFSENDILKML